MKREMKYAVSALLTCLLLGAATVYADNARAVTGSRLTYLLNGSPVYKGSIKVYDAGVADNSTTNGGTGYASFTLSETAATMVQCDEGALVLNQRKDAGTLTYREMVRIAQYEQYNVGILQPGIPFISVSSPDAGTVSCSVYEYK